MTPLFNNAITNKSDINHTHNDNSGLIKVSCEYGNVYKFKKNGWAVVIWQNINLTEVNMGSWVTLAQTGWPNTLQTINFYGNFTQSDIENERFTISPAGNFRVFKISDTRNTEHYGYIVYPTAD